MRSQNPNLRRSDGSYTIWCTDDKKQTVFISEDLDRDLLEKVMCHEMVHVYSFSYDLYISIETEELIADFIASYGRDLLRNVDYAISETLLQMAL